MNLISNMEYQYLYVMDYSDVTIHEITLTGEDIEHIDEPEMVLHKYGFNDGNCIWMFSNEEIEINKVDPEDYN